jgi:hypothetical protein
VLYKKNQERARITSINPETTIFTRRSCRLMDEYPPYITSQGISPPARHITTSRTVCPNGFTGKKNHKTDSVYCNARQYLLKLFDSNRRLTKQACILPQTPLDKLAGRTEAITHFSAQINVPMASSAIKRNCWNQALYRS